MPAHAEKPDWTSWAVLELAVSLTTADLGETLDGGQAFRWQPRETPEGLVWHGVWADNCGEVRLGGDGRLCWRAPVDSPTGPAAMADYFDAGRDYAAVRDALPWRRDPVIAGALARWPGLRILRQPLGETLLCFLCSSTKQIPQIQAGCERMAEHLGEPITGGVHALPTWERLAEAGEEALRACGLGYRARYIAASAEVLAEQPDFLNTAASLPYPQARERLCVLPGVGAKIADCTLLFGAGQLEAFPVDTWILQALADSYGLQGWKPDQLARFGRVHFGAGAGLAQQVRFSARRGQRATPPASR